MNAWLQTILAPNGTRLTVNGRYANQFGGLLDDLTASGYGPDQNQTGGYNPRNIAGTNVVSQHASGRAIDVNWNDNPRGRQGRIDPQVARGLAQKHGMTWAVTGKTQTRCTSRCLESLRFFRSWNSWI